MKKPINHFILFLVFFSGVLCSVPFSFAENSVELPDTGNRAVSTETGEENQSGGARQSPPVSVSEVIMPGDSLTIQIYREPDLSGTFVVDSVGTIVYPLLGRVECKGLSVEEFRTKLIDELSKKYLVTPPQAQVTLQQGSTRTVTILGKIYKGGNYPYFSGMLLTHLISQAQGIIQLTEANDARVIRHDENDKDVIFQVNLGLLMEGKVKDLKLEPGDVVFVSESIKAVSIMGKIYKGGNYPYASGMTLANLISQAQGITPITEANDARVIRHQEGKQDQIFNINLGRLMESREQDLPLEAGDVVFVSESIRTVSVLGQVNKPGNYNFTPDMTLSKVISQAEGFNRYASPGNVKITRVSKSGEKRVFQVNAGSILEGHTEDFKLEPGDLVFVPESLF